MKLTIRYDWIDMGVVCSDEAGKLRFPEAKECPAIYRFTLTKDGAQRVYIGETDRLDRRFQHYRTPEVSQPAFARLNNAMSALLADGGAVGVAAIVHVEIEVDEIHGVLDLDEKAARLLVESAAQTAAHCAGLTVEDPSGL